MYGRLNGMLAIIALLAMFLAVPALTFGDEIGAGPAYVDGHSDDGSYGMNNEGAQSFGGVLHYEKDKNWAKTLGKNKIGIDPGMVYMYLRWTKNENKKRTHTKEIPPEYCYNGGCEIDPPSLNALNGVVPQYETTIENYTKERTINSHILGMYFKPYWEIRNKVRLFALAGPGLEFADDSTNFAAVVGAGLQVRWTDRIATSLTQYEVFSDPTNEYRRFDATVLSLDILF